MNQAQVKVGAVSPSFAAEFDLFLFSDVGGSPGLSLGTLATNLTAPTSDAILAATGFTPISVASGKQYWLVMAPGGSSPDAVGWAGGGNPAAVVQLSPTTNGSGGWFMPTTSGSVQFEIDGTAVATPEPGTGGLLIAAVVFGILKKKRPSATFSACVLRNA